MRVSPALPPYYIAYLLILSQALRELIFGSARGPSFNVEWKKQNFFFCDLPDLEYGLIQHKVCLNMATGVKTEHHWVPTDLTLCCRSPSSEIFCTMFSPLTGWAVWHTCIFWIFSPTHRVGRVACSHVSRHTYSSTCCFQIPRRTSLLGWLTCSFHHDDLLEPHLIPSWWAQTTHDYIMMSSNHVHMITSWWAQTAPHYIRMIILGHWTTPHYPWTTSLEWLYHESHLNDDVIEPQIITSSNVYKATGFEFFSKLPSDTSVNCHYFPYATVPVQAQRSDPWPWSVPSTTSSGGQARGSKQWLHCESSK